MNILCFAVEIIIGFYCKAHVDIGKSGTIDAQSNVASFSFGVSS
jgi:hypothetical protein